MKFGGEYRYKKTNSTCFSCKINSLYWLLLLLQVPCWVVMVIISLSFFLSLTLCTNTVFAFCNHVFKLSRCLTRCLPLFFFPLIIPVVMMFSSPSLLMTCPKNLTCLSLILTHNFLLASALSTSSLVILPMYDNPYLFLRNHISGAYDDIHSSIVDGPWLISSAYVDICYSDVVDGPWLPSIC